MARRLWVLLVTEGFSIAYPPEVYEDAGLAQREGERWAWVLSEASRTLVDRPFAGRWEVGEYWVRVVPAFISEGASHLWVGTYWTSDGVPDPEAALFGTSADAKQWVLTPAPGRVLIRFDELPWLMRAIFKIREDEEDATVHLAKVVVSR